MWHEARRSEKKVHDMMDAARKRAQRRAAYLAKRRGDPIQSIQAVGSRYRILRDGGLYQATEDQQGLIPWNGKQDVMIDRFDGRAMLDFVREAGSRSIRAHKKTEEEEQVEEFVNFERYRDLIKHRRRGFSDEEGLLHVNQELEAKLSAPFLGSRSQPAQPPANKGTYSKVGFSYSGSGKEESLDEYDDEEDDDDDDDDEEEFDSNDSDDEGMEIIAKQFGVKRYGWLVYMDKKAKEEERRQKELIKGDPSIKKLSRKERRKVSRHERDRERETSRIVGRQMIHHDPYRESRRSPTYEAYPRSRRSRSTSRSYSPSYSRRRDYSDEISMPKIEYITEFGGSGDVGSPKFGGYSPPRSPPSQTDLLTRPSPGHILEALHVDPASGVSLEKDMIGKLSKPTPAGSTCTALAKLSKAGTSIGGSSKQTVAEKKETPQERLKRIMNKQLTKQIKKDSATETAKKREQERQRLEKVSETSRLSGTRHRSRSRSYSRSPPPRRRYRRSRSRSRSRRPRRHSSRSRSRSPSRSLSCSPRRSRRRSSSYSRSPRRRSRSRR
ncbi:unnamed protein product [Cochlearia groenlandica]